MTRDPLPTGSRTAEPRRAGAEAVISLRGVEVSYASGAPPALSGADLEIHRGEVAALLGPNGSGKSTLIKAVLGLAPVTAGSLRVQDARIGYVPQRHTVGGGVSATVEEVVASGRLLSRRFLPPVLPARDRRLIQDAIATVGLTEKAGQAVPTLSGGQQRRVLIARALAGEPDVLVMDEPFAGVDTANQQILSGTLAGLAETGRTLLLVTHETGPVEQLIDRAVVIEHGRIRYDGVPDRAVLTRYTGADPHPANDTPDQADVPIGPGHRHTHGKTN